MAEPKEKAVAKEAPAQREVPTTAAEAENAALRNNHFQNFQAAKKGTPTAVLPFGVRVDASRHVKARYTMNDSTRVLGAPHEIVKEEFLREHPGWTYMWPIKDSMRTQAYLDCGRYVKVPWEMVDRTKPNALVAKSATGETVWLRHILVAVPPHVVDEEVTAYEDYAIGRTAQNRATAEAELNEQFSKHGYRAEYSVTDIKQER